MTRPRGKSLATVSAAAITLALAAGCSSTASAVDPLHPRTGPATPAVGVAYPYDLYTHCGVRYAYFDGHWWAADSPSPADPSQGGNPYTGYVTGSMTLTSKATARFDVPHRITATFHPFAGRPQPCS